VNTNGGGKWTFPKGDPESSLSHGQAAEREAWEEAGVRGTIEPRHFCLYIHSKGVFWKPPGVREYVIKAFLLEVDRLEEPQEDTRNPTWFSADEAKKILAKGREVKYARELQAVVERAIEKIGRVQAAATQRASVVHPLYLVILRTRRRPRSGSLPTKDLCIWQHPCRRPRVQRSFAPQKTRASG
jgi:ADP-ribose pyrophosphatase YjhB (NUDIX family)